MCVCMCVGGCEEKCNENYKIKYGWIDVEKVNEMTDTSRDGSVLTPTIYSHNIIIFYR